MIPNLYAVGSASSLRVCSTQRFKAGMLSVSSVLPINRRTACMAPLLLSVLRRGTEKYPTLAEINLRLDYLWGTSFSIRSFYRGNCLILGFTADLLDASYLPEKGEDVTEGVLELIRQLWFHPLLDADGLLSAKYVESEKELQCDAIRAVKNNPRAYAAERCKAILLDGEAGGIPLYGTEEETMAVTREELTAFWREWLEGLFVDCFYVGGEDGERIREQLAEGLINGLTATERNHPAVGGAIRQGRGLRVSETLPVSQSQLLVALRCPVSAGHPDAAACTVMNEMLGNSPISRLFVHVREKQSLCYSCSSVYSPYFGTVLICCGLKRDNRDRAEAEILHQLQCLAEGDFREEELEAAKKSLENAYRQIEDSPSGLENFYYGRALTGNSKSLEEARKAFAGVTAEDVARIARTLTVDVTYFLEGTLSESEEVEEDED